MIYRLIIASLAAATLSAANFVQAPSGLSGAHGNTGNSNNDFINLQSPLLNLNSQCRDTAPGLFSGTSLGAASNGTVVGVVYTNSSNAGILRVLDANCSLIWQSTSIFDSVINNGAPMLGTDNGAAAVDDTQIVRFDPTGTVLWDTCYYGSPTSAPSCYCADGTTLPGAHTGNQCPNNKVADAFSQLGDGSFLVALHSTSGPAYLMNFNSSTGALLGREYIDPTAGNAQSFISNGKPCINGNTAYIATNRSDSTTLGRMYSITVTSGSFATNWKWPASSTYTGPSRSPTCDNSALGGQGFVFVNGFDTPSGYATYFGWNQTTGANIFNCLQPGGGGSCTSSIPVQLVGNAALDVRTLPTRSLWTSGPGSAYFFRISEADGSTLQTIASNLIPGDPCTQSNPGSVPSMTTNPVNGDVILISGLNSVACGARPIQAYLVLIDVTTGLLQSYILLPTGTGFLEGQFPTLLNAATGQYEIAVTSTTATLNLIAGLGYGFAVQTNGPVTSSGPVAIK